MAKEEHHQTELHGGHHEVEHQHGRPHLGPRVSETARKARWIDSVNEHESRPGETLATRSHEVIERWAQERQAVPATVPGTSHDGRPGVLTFDFPGYGGQELEHIGWNDWFKAFHGRSLVFLFQEHLRDGRTSNFFHLDNPRREHD